MSSIHAISTHIITDNGAGCNAAVENERGVCYTVSMIGNIQRIRLYMLLIVFFVLIAGFFLDWSAGAKLQDIRVLNQTRSFSYAVETFKHNYLQYPISNGLDLRRETILTENGFAPGDKVFYQGAIDSPNFILYQADEKAYQMKFTLRRAWPEQGLTDRHCTISTYYNLSCVKK